MKLVDYRHNLENDNYELFPVDDPDIVIAWVWTEQEAQGLLSYINR